MTRPKRCWTREIGNPLTMFHGSSRDREKKWSMERVILWGAFVWFLAHFPAATEWTVWSWAALATIVLALSVETLFAQAPIAEGLAALAAIFGATVSKRLSTSSVVTTEMREDSLISPKVPEP